MHTWETHTLIFIPMYSLPRRLSGMLGHHIEDSGRTGGFDERCLLLVGLTSGRDPRHDRHDCAALQDSDDVAQAVRGWGEMRVLFLGRVCSDFCRHAS